MGRGCCAFAGYASWWRICLLLSWRGWTMRQITWLGENETWRWQIVEWRRGLSAAAESHPETVVGDEMDYNGTATLFRDYSIKSSSSSSPSSSSVKFEWDERNVRELQCSMCPLRSVSALLSQPPLIHDVQPVTSPHRDSNYNRRNIYNFIHCSRNSSHKTIKKKKNNNWQ